MTQKTRIKILLPLFLLAFALAFSLVMALAWSDEDGLSLWIGLLPGTLFKAAVVMVLVEAGLFFLLKPGPDGPPPAGEEAPAAEDAPEKSETGRESA